MEGGKSETTTTLVKVIIYSSSFEINFESNLISDELVFFGVWLT
jgi:hypothetical protein